MNKLLARNDKINDILKIPLKMYDVIERYMVDHRIVKISMISAMLVYHSLLVLGVIFAQWTPDWSAIDGYTIWGNYISDLGGSKYIVPFTPLPILYDLACLFAGVLTVPLTFFIEGIIAPSTSIHDISRWHLRLSNLGFFFGLVGNMGYIGVGIFSEDRNFLGLHGIMSGLAFGGFVICGFFYAFCILIYHTRIPKKFGLYMFFIPPLTLILQFLPSVVPAVSAPLMEWMLLFSVLGWVDPLSIITLIGFKREQKMSAQEGVIEPEIHRKGIEMKLARKFLRKILNLVKKIARFQEDLYTKEMVVKAIAWIGLICYPALLCIGIIVAVPGGFSFIVNTPDALGSSSLTPAPWLFDVDCILASILAIPCAYFLEKMLSPLPHDIGEFPRPRYKLTTYGLIFSLFGSLGFVVLGIFSQDRPMMVGRFSIPVASYATIIGFIAYSLAIICFSGCILLYETGISKLLGLYGVLGPFIALIVWAVSRTAISEWIVLFSMLIFWMLLSIIMLLKILKKLSNPGSKNITTGGDEA